MSTEFEFDIVALPKGPRSEPRDVKMNVFARKTKTSPRELSSTIVIGARLAEEIGFNQGDKVTVKFSRAKGAIGLERINSEGQGWTVRRPNPNGSAKVWITLSSFPADVEKILEKAFLPSERSVTVKTLFKKTGTLIFEAKPLEENGQ